MLTFKVIDEACPRENSNGRPLNLLQGGSSRFFTESSHYMTASSLTLALTALDPVK